MKSKEDAIDPKELRRFLSYDQKRGTFTWLARTPDMFSDGIRSKEKRCNAWNSKNAGTKAGWDDGHGRIMISIKKLKFMAHRVAYAYVTGEWPSNEIDHINMNPADNRWCNLRKSTSSQNKANTKIRVTNTSGYKGVVWHKNRQRWMARGTINYRQVFLGYFDDPSEAHKAYINWAEKAFGEYSRFN